MLLQFLFYQLKPSLGTVRKVLSVGFVGESRESGQIYIVDARLEGLQGGDVRNHVCFHAYTYDSTKTGILFLGRSKESDVRAFLSLSTFILKAT